MKKLFALMFIFFPLYTMEQKEQLRLGALTSKTVAKQVIHLWDKHLSTSDDKTNEEKTKATTIVHDYLNPVPLEQQESIYCAIVKDYDRADIVASQLLINYKRDSNKALSFFLTLCSQAQKLVWDYLYSKNDTSFELLTGIIEVAPNNLVYQIIASLPYPTEQKIDRIIQDTIKVKAQSNIDKAHALDSPPIHFTQEVKDWAAKLFSQYQNMHFILQDPPAHLKNDILTYLTLIVGPTSLENAIAIVPFISFNLEATFEDLLQLYTLFRKTYPHTQSLLHTPAEFFSPRAIVQQFLSKYLIMRTSDILFTFIRTDMAQAVTLLKKFDDKTLRLKLLASLISSYNLIPIAKHELFLDSLIELFLPINTHELDEFIDYFRQAHKLLKIKINFETLLSKHLLKNPAYKENINISLNKNL